MVIETEIKGESLIAKVKTARLLAAESGEFKERLQACLRQHSGPSILDLSDVEFVDSSGLGAIVALFKTRKDLGGLELAGLQPNVLSLLKLTKLDKIFIIHESL